MCENRANVDEVNDNGETPVRIASDFDHLESIEELCKHKANVNIGDKFDITPIQMSMGAISTYSTNLKCGEYREMTREFARTLKIKMKVILKLIEYNGDVHTWYDGKNLAYLAAEYGDFEALERLVEFRANVNSPSLNHLRPIDVAVQCQRQDIFQFLLGLVEEKRTDDLLLQAMQQFKEANSDLSKQHNIVKIIISLIRMSADPKTASVAGRYPLHLMAEIGNHEAIPFLTKECCCDIDLIGEDGFTPLHIAAKMGHLEAIETLISCSAAVQAVSGTGETALSLAIEQRNMRVVNLLVRHGADANALAAKDNPILHLALEKGSDIEELINGNADVNAQNSEGLTALGFAAKLGRTEGVMLLLEHGADTRLGGNWRVEEEKENDISDSEGHGNTKKDKVVDMIPIIVAAMNGHKETVAVLLSFKADANATDDSGRTPIHFAALQGHCTLLMCLLRAKGDINRADVCGKSPLHCAAEEMKGQMVETLIRHKANVNVVDKQMRTPLQICIGNSNFNAIDHLVMNGAAVKAAYLEKHQIAEVESVETTPAALNIRMSQVNKIYSSALIVLISV